MEVFRSEIRVGLLILAAFILLGAGIFITSDIRTVWEDKRALSMLFPYADGITRGAPVWYAGFEVGEVSEIRIAHDTTDRIAITARIDPEAIVRRDSRVEIRSLGMMGAKYVEISPGSPESPPLAPGESLEGRSPASLSEVIESGQQVAVRFVDLVQETQSLVRELREEASLKDAFRNANAFLVEMREQGEGVEALVRKLTVFADSLNETVQHVKQATGEGGKDLTALLKELRETNRDLRQGIVQVQGQLARTFGQIDKGFCEAQDGVKDIRSVVGSSGQDVTSLLKNLNEASRHLEALSEELRAHPWKVVWKEDGPREFTPSAGTQEWRDKGRIGPHGTK